MRSLASREYFIAPGRPTESTAGMERGEMQKSLGAMAHTPRGLFLRGPESRKGRPQNSPRATASPRRPYTTMACNMHECSPGPSPFEALFRPMQHGPRWPACSVASDNHHPESDINACLNGAVSRLACAPFHCPFFFSSWPQCRSLQASFRAAPGYKLHTALPRAIRKAKC